MRKLIQKMAGWIHASLILAIIIPFLYALVAKQPDPLGQTLYLKCLVIIFPVVLTDLSIDKCKGLFSYLILCALIFAVTQTLGMMVSGPMRQETLFFGYALLLACETALIVFSRLAERLNKRKAEKAAKTSDPTWHPSYSILRQPSFLTLIYFTAVYFIAINLNNSSVCNAALFSAALYTPVTFLYQYICKTENYLSLNKRTCNIPSKRIYGIGSGMLAIFLLLFMVTMLPAFFTISNRHYRDLREWNDRIKIDGTDLIPENNTENTGESPMDALFEGYAEPKPTPQWLIAVFHVIEAAIFLFLGAALLKMIRTVFRDFRRTNDENGDIVEELKETTETDRKISIPTNRHKLSEQERIRKEYRKTIRRHRKDRPAVCESPTEIETIAGIVDSEEGKAIHKQYELARYGREADRGS